MKITDLRLEMHVVVFTLQDDALRVLLTPVAGDAWQLPATRPRADESLEEAATRAISGLMDRHHIYLEQLYTYGARPRPGELRCVSVAYFALAPAHACSTAGGPECWFPIGRMPALTGNQSEIVAYALRRLRYKLEYSAVGFQLLPDEFTLSELQHTYEIILGEKLDKRNFRRRILQAGVIEPTSRRRAGEGRPARLYRYRPDAVAEVKARRLFP